MSTQIPTEGVSLTGVMVITISLKSEDFIGGLSSSLPPATAPSQFLHKSLWPRSLTLLFKTCRFWLRILGDIRILKSTPRISDSGDSFFQYEYLRELEVKIGTTRKVV